MDVKGLWTLPQTKRSEEFALAFYILYNPIRKQYLEQTSQSTLKPEVQDSLSRCNYGTGMFQFPCSLMNCAAFATSHCWPWENEASSDFQRSRSQGIHCKNLEGSVGDFHVKKIMQFCTITLVSHWAVFVQHTKFQNSVFFFQPSFMDLWT